jgi:fructose-1,6-bisphosphatase I
MITGMRLEDYLASSVGQDAATTQAVAETVLAIAAAGRQIAELLAAGPLAGNLAAHRGDSHGDTQKEMDLRADALLLAALRVCPVACVASEERDTALPLRAGAPLAVALDPLDGSSNIDTAAPVGTIFSILPAPPGEAEASFLRPGTDQLAAGFVLYGSQTALALTRGDGTHIFTLDRETGAFIAAVAPAGIPLATSEYAINASNQRHWAAPIRRFVAECQQGAAGPRGKDYNTRWIASMVADAFRILVRGGVYLYPGDARAGHAEGRLRLVYEANPVAWLIEQAGGAATDGQRRILDLLPSGIHQRVPLVFGAVEEVALIASYHGGTETPSTDPLFGKRSLFRAHSDHRGVLA